MTTQETVTLAHLSDLHLRRGYPERARIVGRALALDEIAGADLVVVSGDVTESGLTHELETAEELLSEVAGQGRLLVVPGNHDASVHGLNAGTIVNRLSGARHAVSERLARLSVRGGDARRIGSGSGPWPVRRDLLGGRVVVYGLDSTQASFGDLLARGCCGKRQLEALDEDLDTLPKESSVVFVLHHHVTRHPSGRGAFDVDPAMELVDKRDVQRLLRRYRVELVLHGHRHRFWQRQFRDTQILGGASTTLGCNRSKERFVLLVTLSPGSGEVTVRLRYLDRDDVREVRIGV